MATFRDQLRNFSVKLNNTTQEVFSSVVLETQRSIVDGSELTGAPGQPVDTGALKSSWQAQFESPTRAVISTNIVYAPYIEDGGNSYGPFTLRSAVGGFHSAALTVAGFDRIVEFVTAQVSARSRGYISVGTTDIYGEEGG